MDFFNIIKDVLSKPKDFFTNIRKEKGIKSAFLYFLIFAAITTFLNTLYFYKAVPRINLPQIGSNPGLIVGIMAAFYIMILVLAVLSIFIVSGIIHLFVLLMKGKDGFYQTFKIKIYGDTPRYILSIILSPIYIVFFPKFLGMKQPPVEFFIWLIPITILGLITTVYAFYLKTMGIKKLHKISTFRAFAAVFLLPLALFLIIYAVFFIIALAAA